MDSPHYSHHRALLVVGIVTGLAVLAMGLLVHRAADDIPRKVAEALNSPYSGDAPSP